jgi:hypothetical protein
VHPAASVGRGIAISAVRGLNETAEADGGCRVLKSPNPTMFYIQLLFPTPL